MIDTLLPVLPVVLLFVAGFALQKINFFSSEAIVGIKRIVSDIALPALMFKAFLSIEASSSSIILVAAIFLTCLVMVALGRFIAPLVKISSPYFSIMMGGFEMGMLGYALFLALYGSENLGKIALVDLGQVLFVFFVLMALLIKERDGVQNPKVLVKQFVSSPVIIAILSGLILSFFADRVEVTPLLQSLSSFIDMVGSLTVPLIAISIGYTIHIDTGNLALSVKTIVVRKILALIFVLILNSLIVESLLGLDRMYSYAMMVMFLTPPPFVISIFMKQSDKKNMDYVANTLSLETVISIIMIIAAAALYV
ncbi:MAG: permease [Sphaerochaetaceae bacterium]|nr:permease [Sphaerochaetaceae bacterium]